jgi:hypothetical protein
LVGFCISRTLKNVRSERNYSPSCKVQREVVKGGERDEAARRRKLDYLPCMCEELMMNAATGSAPTSRRRKRPIYKNKKITYCTNWLNCISKCTLHHASQTYFVFLYLLSYICCCFRWCLKRARDVMILYGGIRTSHVKCISQITRIILIKNV